MISPGAREGHVEGVGIWLPLTSFMRHAHSVPCTQKKGALSLSAFPASAGWVVVTGPAFPPTRCGYAVGNLLREQGPPG